VPKTTWHVCHHCDGVGCEVCEYDRGWFETAAERDARLEEWGWLRTLCEAAGAANSQPGPE
jgi:hypothetical protein